jgi:hypothetical protein
MPVGHEEAYLQEMKMHHEKADAHLETMKAFAAEMRTR